MRHRSTMILLALLFAAAPGQLFAGPKEDAAAKKKQGDQLAAEGNLEGALQAYQEGKALSADTEFELALAQTLVRLRRYPEAKEAYQAYLTTTKNNKHKNEVKKAIGELEQLLRTKLTCDSTPSGATVYLNSRVDSPLGTTPLVANLPPGSHRLLFEKEGFSVTSLSVSISEGDDLRDCAVTLAPMPFALEIESQPQGAEILVNGASKGKAPLTVELSGKSEVELSLEGYETQKQSFSGAPGERLRWEASLVEKESGLSLALLTQGAVASLDGAPLAEGFTAAPPGVHQLSASAPGYATLSQEITIAKGEKQQVSIRLVPSSGFLSVKLNQKQAKLFIDSQEQPLAARMLLAEGSHQLRVTMEGFATYEGALNVANGDLFLADVTLKKPRTQRTSRLLIGSGASLALMSLTGVVALHKANVFNGKISGREGGLLEDKEASLAYGRTSNLTLAVGVSLGAVGLWRYHKEGASTATITKENKDVP